MEDSADNRSRLLDAALGLFAERGYDAVGVQEIATSLELTKPTLYHYFGSKQGLLEVLVKERGEALLRRLDAAAAFSGDVPLSLERTAFCLCGAARQDPQFFRFLLAEIHGPASSGAAPVSRLLAAELRGRLERLFREAAGQIGNMNGRERQFAATFWGVLAAWIAMGLEGQASLDDDAVRGVLRQFMHGIYS